MFNRELCRGRSPSNRRSPQHAAAHKFRRHFSPEKSLRRCYACAFAQVKSIMIRFLFHGTVWSLWFDPISSHEEMLIRAHITRAGDIAMLASGLYQPAQNCVQKYVLEWGKECNDTCVVFPLKRNNFHQLKDGKQERIQSFKPTIALLINIEKQ